MFTFKHKKKKRFRQEKLLFGMKLREVQEALNILFHTETPIIEEKYFLNDSSLA